MEECKIEDGRRIKGVRNITVHYHYGFDLSLLAFHIIRFLSFPGMQFSLSTFNDKMPPP